MNVLKLLLLLAIPVFLLLPKMASQGVPLTISYQALLTDDDRDPLSPDSPTNYPVVFRIYDAAEGGNLLWAEAQNVSVFKGSFSTQLGDGEEVEGEPTAQLDTVFQGAYRYLEVTITEGATDKTFMPRQQMVSSPFAFRSKVSEHALTVADGSISASHINNGSVTQAKLAENSVASQEIQAGAVGMSELADNAVSSGEIVDGSIELEDLAELVVNRLQPAGTIVAWAGLPEERTLPTGDTLGGVPEGWLLCDGESVPTASYPELFRAVGYLYGGSGNEFHLPDYRGYFLRGQSVNSAQDPDRPQRSKATPWAETNDLFEGSSQADQYRAHTHANGVNDQLIDATSKESLVWEGPWGSSYKHVYTVTGSAAGVSSGGSETRPKNRYVWYIIKAH